MQLNFQPDVFKDKNGAAPCRSHHRFALNYTARPDKSVILVESHGNSLFT